MSLTKRLKAAATDRLRTWRRKLSTTTQKISLLQRNVEEKDRANAEMEKQVENLQRQLVFLQKREEESSRNGQSLREDLLKAAEGIVQLRKTNVQLGASLIENRTLLKNLEIDNQALRKEKTRIQSELHDTKKELTAIGEVLDSIRQNLDETESEVEEEMEVDQPTHNNLEKSILPQVQGRPVATEGAGSSNHNVSENITGHAKNRPIKSVTKENAVLGKSSKQPAVLIQDMVDLKGSSTSSVLPRRPSSKLISPSTSRNARVTTEVTVPAPCTSTQAVATVSVSQAKVASGKDGQNLASTILHAEDEDILNSAPGRFGCICGVTLASRRGLLNHIRYHTDRRFSCTMCKRQIHGHSVFKNHLVNDHGITLDHRSAIGCNRCALSYPTKAEFYQHCREVHSGPSKEMYQGKQRQPLAIQEFMSSSDDTTVAIMTKQPTAAKTKKQLTAAKMANQPKAVKMTSDESHILS